ncbi:type III pantothenate kinase [Kordia sp. YSTF-M3]|uniref:Type III pantothenate kinase n=1 Tax=Kordia aestuariivivens TaxID=2759037 RepID=A0ABR7QAC5_9FLAO|nr:type III pantothenate kinase [Kordia aestuariivivens]MBC8755428.1 type III pantothenate kinase [Kordia aestuariivivens]
MNLIVDAGNTYVKVAVFQGDKMLSHESFEKKLFQKKIEKLLKTHAEIDQMITSSVTTFSDDTKQFIANLDLKVHKLTHKTKVPFQNNYATPETLGVDRIALVVAAVAQYPKTNVLVIDAGTCITYDFKTSDEIYLGGGISPGIQLRYKTLNLLTANLPLLEPKVPENYIGNTTESAIHSGVTIGVITEIDGIIERYKGQFEHLTVILTGGDTNFLAKRLKNTIFANSKFLLQGLNTILEYNRYND